MYQVNGMEVIRVYHELTEKRELVSCKRKRLESELDELKNSRKCAKRICIKNQLDELMASDQEAYLELARLKMQEMSRLSDENGIITTYEASRSRLFSRIGWQQYSIQLLQEAMDHFVRRGGDEQVFLCVSDRIHEKITYLLALWEEEYRMPYARPFFVVPITTLPFAFHPNVNHRSLTTGTIHADIWQHLLSSHKIENRATLRVLRLCCISMAILVHSMPSELTGYLICA
jgi:hypothetical protein